MKIDADALNAFALDLEVAPDRQRYLFMAKRERVDYVFNTSALEGNAMTYPEVQTLLEGITVGGHKLSDEQMILNQNESVKLLFELLEKNEFCLDKATILSLHEKVSYKEAISWGAFRDGAVNIGGTAYLPPKASELDSVFGDGVDKLNRVSSSVVRAIASFLFFAKCQFFWDGNKRAGRLMMNGILLDSGYPMLNIKAKDRLEFNTKMIEFYESDNILKTLEYLVNYYKNQISIFKGEG